MPKIGHHFPTLANFSAATQKRIFSANFENCGTTLHVSSILCVLYKGGGVGISDVRANRVSSINEMSTLPTLP